MNKASKKALLELIKVNKEKLNELKDYSPPDTVIEKLSYDIARLNRNVDLLWDLQYKTLSFLETIIKEEVYNASNKRS